MKPMLRSQAFRVVMFLSALASSSLVIAAGQRWRCHDRPPGPTAGTRTAVLRDGRLFAAPGPVRPSPTVAFRGGLPERLNARLAAFGVVMALVMLRRSATCDTRGRSGSALRSRRRKTWEECGEEAAAPPGSGPGLLVEDVRPQERDDAVERVAPVLALFQPWPSSSYQWTSWNLPSISSASTIRSVMSGTTRCPFGHGG